MSAYTLIAETDASGNVACVWISQDNKPGARTFDPQSDTKILHDKPACFGSDPDAIMSWIKAQI
jgi:hypothetical protein